MNNSMPPTEKTCKQCHQTKEITQFNRDRRISGGYRDYCKQCTTKHQTRICNECQVKQKIGELIRATNIRAYYCKPCWEALQGKKKCIGCHEIKPLQEFAEDKSRPDGHEYYCRDCRREHQIKKHAKTILQRGTKQCMSCRKVKAFSEYFENHSTRDNIDIYCKQCRTVSTQAKKQEKDKSRVQNDLRMSQRRVRKLRSLYGITEKEYISLYNQQQGLCAICGRPERKSLGKTLCVDHNHFTGKVRGLLCSNCNSGLGHFEENLDYLNRAIEYLGRYDKKEEESATSPGRISNEAHTSEPGQFSNDVDAAQAL
ncbi:MAG: endonuclease VII domain-containing protein [Ktedonobacteraceae bacterium]